MSHIEFDQQSDDYLLRQIENGDRVAFDQLFDKYWAKGYSNAYKRLQSKDDAKDVVQEIFIKIWVNRQTGHIDNFPAYLHTAIRNQVIKLLVKQKKVNSFLDVLENSSNTQMQADGQILWQEFLVNYESMVETLPPKRKVIFRLRFDDNLPIKAIALQMGITTKTVYNQLGRAIETLKSTLLAYIILIGLIANNFFP